MSKILTVVQPKIQDFESKINYVSSINSLGKNSFGESKSQPTPFASHDAWSYYWDYGGDFGFVDWRWRTESDHQ
jgi:hypothetical protein